MEQEGGSRASLRTFICSYGGVELFSPLRDFTAGSLTQSRNINTKGLCVSALVFLNRHWQGALLLVHVIVSQ